MLGLCVAAHPCEHLASALCQKTLRNPTCSALEPQVLRPIRRLMSLEVFAYLQIVVMCTPNAANHEPKKIEGTMLLGPQENYQMVNKVMYA